MIKVTKLGNGIYAPVIACNFCGEPINDGQGNFLWNPEGDGNITEIYFTHKSCDRGMRDRLAEQGITTMWMELDLFLLSLINNTKVDIEQAKKDHTAFKDVGLVS